MFIPREPFFRSMTDPWRKESLNLKIGDWIIWKDEKIEIQDTDSLLEAGMIGNLISVHGGIPFKSNCRLD